MENKFRSKEVYKKLRKEVHNRHTMVAVEGVYVSGEYRPPYYANMGVTITDIQCNKALVEPFTDVSVIATDFDYALQLLDIDVNPTCPSITRYTTATTEETDFDYALQLLDIDVDPACPSLQKYQTVQETLTDFDYALQLLDIDVNETVPIQSIPIINTPMTPEPIVRITQINSTKAEITNVT